MTKKKTVATITRSAKHPRIAYIIIPKGMVPDSDRVDILMNSKKVLAFDFHAEGKTSVYRTSRDAATVRINFPIGVVDEIPYGAMDCTLAPRGGLFIVTGQ